MRRFLTNAVWVCAVSVPLFVASLASADGGAREPNRPNILIIITDDQRAHGTMQPMAETRRLFWQHGAKFDWAIASTPQCCPSRASIFSGQYAHNHGVISNQLGTELDTTHTMQFELDRSGYNTAILGRYLNRIRESPPHFDKWAVMQAGYRTVQFNLNGRLVEATYSTSFIEKKAQDFLRAFEAEDYRPWMMVLSPWAPHKPARPEREFADAPVEPFSYNPANTETDVGDKPEYVHSIGGDISVTQALRERQLRTLMSVDSMVAEVYGELASLDEANNTLAFFVSDNGLMWYEHGIRNTKRLPYNESVMVPFYVRWPGHVAPGTSIERRVVANIDIAPTVFEATGIQPSYAVDGKDIFTSKRKFILIESWFDPEKPEIPTWRARWSPASSYVRYESESDSREFYEFDDPWQLENIYKDGIANNEPSEEALWDQWLIDAGSCAGPDCP